MALSRFIPYLRDIYKKRTRPHTYSWLIWATLQTIAVVAQFKTGAGYGAWALVIGAMFCLIIFILSFQYSPKIKTPHNTVHSL